MRLTFFSNLKSKIVSLGTIITILVLLLALYAGISFGQGRQKTVFLLLLGVAFIYINVLNSTVRFMLLLAGLYLSLVTQIPIIPYGLTLGEGILVLLAVWQLFFGQKLSSFYSRQSIIVLCTFLAFAFISLILSIYHNDLTYWHIVSLTPVLWLFLTMHMVRTPRQTLRVIKSALFLIVGFIFLVWLAKQTGHVIQNYGPQWRFGGEQIAFGPIVQYVYSVHLGGLIALGVPIAIMLMIREGETMAARFMYGLVLVLLLVVLVTTAARGPAIAALLSAILMLLLLGKLSVKIIFLISVITIILLLVLSSFSQQLAPQWARFSELNNVSGITNFNYRINVLSTTIRELMQNPLGGGYDYLWNKYGIGDEANIYTPILNGTGVIGITLFILMLVQLGQCYASHIFRARYVWEREFAALGFCVLIAELVAGISAHNVVVNVKDAFVFWSILTACYSVLQLHRNAE